MRLELGCVGLSGRATWVVWTSVRKIQWQVGGVQLQDRFVDVVIQRIRTSWTKQSRGGPEAAIRNAAPVAFPLPSVTPPFVHEVWMREAEDFQPRFEIRAGLPGSADDAGVFLRPEDDGRLRVQPAVTPFGIPRRTRRPPAVRLVQGEWLRWQINYRFAYGGAWTYRLDTLNIANGTVPEVLFMGAPTHHVDELTGLR